MRDILLKNMDIVFTADGGLAVGETDEQNVELLLISEKGEWKESPLCGVGLKRYLKSTEREKELKREITVQLKNDGYTPKSIELDKAGNLKLEL